ncbi:PhzF family phenazine biosynthesis protein [Pedococcus sp. 5OH_020]|uniref:PhzF family phenazine biosynthesis protein n=1 Tax=Pedococcus sp. 5OH_020 TaxID=2989814 RepID=UPI0022EA0B66|nr:PhzF family phenazine biosynthesis protein [Pedococcus sp. 5OH_020]
MPLPYRLLNVFAEPGNPFSGNPLCVFEDGSPLSEGQLQGLARQFNLSETTFVLGPTTGGHAAVRIFTTASEMPFAGHPTLGTAHVVRDLWGLGDDLALSMPAGIVPVRATGDEWTLTALTGTVERDLDSAELARALGLQPSDLLPPAQQVSVGTSQVMARASSVEAVRRARPDAAAMARYGSMGVRGGETLVYLWAETGDGELEARALISDGVSISEDAATGSACSNLGAWFAARSEMGEWTVRQGRQLGRPSTLRLSVGSCGTVRVGGLVREVGRGVVDLDRAGA